MATTSDSPQSLTSARELIDGLNDSYRNTLSCMRGFIDQPPPYLPIINPPVWEAGHAAWFLERWCLRRPAGNGAPPLLPCADQLYNSSRIAHSARWFLKLPGPRQTLDYLRHVTEAVLERIESAELPPPEKYYMELALYHQDMHNEAFVYTRQTLGQPTIQTASAIIPSSMEADVKIPKGTVMLGAQPATGFSFDNEKWAHEIHVPAYNISSQLVSNNDFLVFVADGGYLCREYWCESGWCWRNASGRRCPAYWRQTEGWQQRVFDQWLPLMGNAPVMHINAFEAEAYCRWAGRRLPSEAEWERAAVHAQAECEQMHGNVWQWTSSPFQPYPGFSPDPYAEYSQPWFGTHRVLRGSSWATPQRLRRNGFRNFYTAERADIFAGFRTCAL